MEAINQKGGMIFSIGHSRHSIEYFIDLLKKYRINNIVDVRSTPYSRHASQYNREIFKNTLSAHKITYIYMGDCLGARYSEPKFLDDNGRVDFKRVSASQEFNEAISKLIKGVKKGFRIAMMCSEKDPFNCHRFVLISRHLEKIGITVQHILDNGDVILNRVLERKLLKKYNKDLQQFNLFGVDNSREAVLEEAYKKRNKDIAYSI